MQIEKLFLFIIIILLFIVTAQSATLRVGMVNEDYHTIQDAVNAAQPRDIIEVMAGIYRENLVIDKPLSLVAIGHAIIDAGGDYFKGPAVKLMANGITVEGFTITNSTNTAGDPYAGAGIEIRSANNILKNNTIQKNYRSGVKIFSGKNNTIINNSIQNNYEGILMAESNDNNVAANIIMNNAGSGLTFIVGSRNNSVEKNVISKNSAGIVLKDSSFNNISNNNFVGNLGDDINLLAESISNNFYQNEMD
jgi:nitrous oxidase accessory protein